MSDGILFDLTEDSLADEALDDVSDRLCAFWCCRRVFSRCNLPQRRPVYGSARH